MEKGLLITLPKYDDVTEYLAVFSEPIISECKQKGIKFKVLAKENANKKNFESNIQALNYNLIVMNGHGAINCITGHKEEKIINVGDNEHLLCDRITYARSCWSAFGLGKSCMKNNKTGCFIGYMIPFMFLMNITWAPTPIKDNLARIFFDTSNLVPIGLIKGQTANQANENSKKSMLKLIKKTLLKGEDNSQIIAETLWNNYSGQVLIGNPEATIN